MSTSFYKGQTLGPDDLNIFLSNSSDHPVNAAEISYALYDFTTGQEVLLGVPRRIPVNEAIGHYYASVVIPLDSQIGSYRIRWTTREYIGGPLNEVVQEFEVTDKSQIVTSYIPDIESDLVRRLRISLRDNCIGGEEVVEVSLYGENTLVTMAGLYEAITSKVGPLFEAFKAEELTTPSVSPEGEIVWTRVLDVMRAETGAESIVRVYTNKGSSIMTGGHRVFLSPTQKVEAEKLRPGCIVDGGYGKVVVTGIEPQPNRQYMYDLTAEGWHNFYLHGSGMLVSNSPDRNYHFRPPSHEETVRQYNRVIGYIWEDHELQDYLHKSMSRIALAPPFTPFTNITSMMQNMYFRHWDALLIDGAMISALMAVSINWVADEFGYSIGGVSLDLEKSSKYQQLQQAISDQFDKQLENAKATVKITKGLKQSRFGVGVRSAFGPHVGSGILSPRKFIG